MVEFKKLVFNRNISNLLLVLFFCLIFTVNVYAIEKDFYVTSGSDYTGNVVRTLDINDLIKINSSDNNWLINNGTLPKNVLNYDETKYIEFIFSPDVPSKATINNVLFTIEYQRMNNLKISKLEFFDGLNFIDEVLFNPFISNSDITITAPISYLNTSEKINDLKVRFLAYTDDNSDTFIKYDLFKINVNYTYDPDNINPEVTLVYPENYINLSNSLVDFNCSFTDDINLANASLFINSNLNQTNFISGKINQTNFSLNLEDGEYSWNCLAYDDSGNPNFALNNFTFRIDTLKPTINNISTSSITSNSALITWETNELTNSTINYETNFNDQNFTLLHSFILNSLNPNTVYFYNITSCDLVNNCNISSQFTFTTLPQPVSDSPGGSGGGGGGGGGGNSNINPIENTENSENQVNNNLVNIPVNSLDKVKEVIEENNVLQEEQPVQEDVGFFQKIFNFLTGKDNTVTGQATEGNINTKNRFGLIISGLIVIFGLLFYFFYIKKNKKK